MNIKISGVMPDKTIAAGLGYWLFFYQNEINCQRQSLSVPKTARSGRPTYGGRDSTQAFLFGDYLKSIGGHTMPTNITHQNDTHVTLIRYLAAKSVITFLLDSLPCLSISDSDLKKITNEKLNDQSIEKMDIISHIIGYESHQ